MTKDRLSDQQRLVLVALSLGTPELRRGLNVLLHCALQFASQDEDWDLIDDVLEYDDYDLLCVQAAHAWIQRVTGDAFTSAMEPKPRDK